VLSHAIAHAIARPPAPSYVDGITSADLGRPELALALRQHAAYVQALRDCGLEVTVLEPAPAFPDACFVEDCALLTARGAVLTRPGAETRRGEAALIEPEIADRFEHLAFVEAPGTLDAGDVLQVDDHFFVGLSARTNRAGAEQLLAILEGFGYTGEAVPMREMLHLKTGVNALPDRRLLVTGEFVDARAFAGFERIVVPAEEAYAANSLWINDAVIVPAGFPRTLESIRALEVDVIEVDVSEFRKMDGGLSCLSLRY
jgi:dimethylargininase